MSEQSQAEYRALRDTIRERGTARMWTVLGGLAAWGALSAALLITEIGGAMTLVPLVVLASTYEINFFVHTGVERIGRYIQVFYEERDASVGWETIAMKYGAKFPSGLDPLFSNVFAAAALVNFLASMAVAGRRPGWVVLSLAGHLVFAYRMVSTRATARSQRALDLERFRNLASEK
jgi:hypothetical protein